MLWSLQKSAQQWEQNPYFLSLRPYLSDHNQLYIHIKLRKLNKQFRHEIRIIQFQITGWEVQFTQGINPEMSFQNIKKESRRCIVGTL